jgi:hypothetical protein
VAYGLSVTWQIWPPVQSALLQQLSGSPQPAPPPTWQQALGVEAVGEPGAPQARQQPGPPPRLLLQSQQLAGLAAAASASAGYFSAQVPARQQKQTEAKSDLRRDSSYPHYVPSMIEERFPRSSAAL